MEEKTALQIQNLPGIPAILPSIHQSSGLSVNKLGEPQFSLWGIGTNQLGGSSSLLSSSLSSMPSVPMHHSFLNLSNFGVDQYSINTSGNVNVSNTQQTTHTNNPQGIPTSEYQKKTKARQGKPSKVGRSVSIDTMGSFDEFEQSEKRQRSEQSLLSHSEAQLEESIKVADQVVLNFSGDDFGNIFEKLDQSGGDLLNEYSGEPPASQPDAMWEVAPPSAQLCPALKRLYNAMREDDANCAMSSVALFSLSTKDKCRRILSLRSQMSSLAGDEESVIRTGAALGLI